MMSVNIPLNPIPSPRRIAASKAKNAVTLIPNVAPIIGAPTKSIIIKIDGLSIDLNLVDNFVDRLINLLVKK